MIKVGPNRTIEVIEGKLYSYGQLVGIVYNKVLYLSSDYRSDTTERHKDFYARSLDFNTIQFVSDASLAQFERIMENNHE